MKEDIYGHPIYDAGRAYFRITNDDFCAVLYEDTFTQLSLRQLKGLFKLMFKQPYKNDEAIERLDELLPEQGVTAYGAWYDASEEYQCKYSNSPMAKHENQALYSAVKKAKAHFERLGKIYEMFLKMKSEVLL